jgi:hypothetical protein
MMSLLTSLTHKEGWDRDALSPYLFVIAINELSIRLQEALHNYNLSGISLEMGAPPIHSMSFANNRVKLPTSKNPPFVSAGLFLLT